MKYLAKEGRIVRCKIVLLLGKRRYSYVHEFLIEDKLQTKFEEFLLSMVQGRVKGFSATKEIPPVKTAMEYCSTSQDFVGGNLGNVAIIELEDDFVVATLDNSRNSGANVALYKSVKESVTLSVEVLGVSLPKTPQFIVED